MTIKIADSEWRIMTLLWEEAPQTAQDISDQLAHKMDWSPNTVKTLLNRLVKKGALNYEKEGRAFLYTPAVAEEDCRRDERKSFLNRVYGGSLKPMLAAFLKDETLSDEEIEELKKILEQHQK